MQYLFTAAPLPRSTFLVNRLVCREATLSLLTAVSDCFNRYNVTLTAHIVCFNRRFATLILLRRLFLLLARHRLSKLISTLASFVGSPLRSHFNRNLRLL